MSRQLGVIRCRQFRGVLLAATLASHLLATLGFPLPVARQSKDISSRPFPCQARPCGCLTADECWKGDCCCFTLEEKLIWAEENGVEPPESVRPLVESRKGRSAPSEPKKASCCSNPGPVSTPPVSDPPACCKEKLSCEAGAAAECPQCAVQSEPEKFEQGPTPAHPSDIRWVVGIFAQKCRGEGPSGTFQLEPAFAPDLTPHVRTEPEHSNYTAPCSEQTNSVTHTPPTRPPRSC